MKNRINGNGHPGALGRRHGNDNVQMVTRTTPEGATLTQAKHQGPSGHGSIPPGGQCYCGWLNLGVKP